MRIGHHGSEDPVYGITTAEQSHIDDISRRQKQYILTMSIRVVSIIVVVSVPGISWPFKLLLCLVATIIPYIAVVRANGGPAPEKDPTNLLLTPPEKPALGWEQPGLPGGGRVVPGEADEAGADADETPDSPADGGAAGTDGPRGSGEPDEPTEPREPPEPVVVLGADEYREAADPVGVRRPGGPRG